MKKKLIKKKHYAINKVKIELTMYQFLSVDKKKNQSIHSLTFYVINKN